jgi:hypothetical protein
MPPTSLIIDTAFALSLGAFNLDAPGRDGVDFFIAFCFSMINRFS